MNNVMKGITSAIVISISIIVAYGLIASAPQAVRVDPEEVATAIRVQKIDKESIRLMIRSQGTVSPKTASTLIPEVSGKVKWISPNLAVGGYFALGEVLVKIDDIDLIASVQKSKAFLARSTADAEHKNFEYKRLHALVEKRLTSQSDLETALRAKRIANAQLIEAEVNLKQAERDLQRTEIKAPYAGLVREKSVDVGQFVSRGSKIANIYSSDAVEVRVPLADKQLSYLDLPLGQRGELPIEQQANVTLSTHYGGKYYEWHGKLVRTEAEIDTRTRMVNAVVRVEEDKSRKQPPLPVGLFVHANIEGRIVEDIVVLPRAVIRNQNQVLVVDKRNRLRYRNVELLRFDEDSVFIEKGLEKGELVNLSPIQTVIDGMRVKPVHAKIEASIQAENKI
ncbi:MAG: efflux RND transporter periplasmic adaptor subunit [Pseudomonadales bacterium]|nr:efflux RND transporter periplasmic adaptor subunit [Pseudomonadales bacterium]